MENTTNQPSKCKTKNCVGVNDDSRGTYNINSQIKFKTTMLKSTLCDYSYVYVLVKWTISFIVQGADAGGIQADRNNKKY